MAPRSQTELACARVVGMTKAACLGLGSRGVPLVTPLQTPPKAFWVSRPLSTPRSMWKVELALLLTRDELRIPRQSPLPQPQELIDVWNR